MRPLSRPGVLSSLHCAALSGPVYMPSLRPPMLSLTKVLTAHRAARTCQRCAPRLVRPWPGLTWLAYRPVLCVICQLLELWWHRLSTPPEHLDDIPRHLCILGSEHRVSHPLRSRTASPSDAVHIALTTGGAIVVDHMPDLFDVQPTLGHICRNQDWLVPILELLQHPIPLLLWLVAVDRQPRPAVDSQLARQLVAAALRAAEDEDLRSVHDVLE
mmetsp:Transcript_38187/g.86588  ORF Transcript_38187/g.86588 Transcript_38187/m.86588 type:complete len:215 (+) Transcript_38187:366-1010(+)